MWPESGKALEDYHTPEDAGGWFGRLFPNPVYYVKAYLIVKRAAKLTQEGGYDRKAWADSSRETIRAFESVGARFTVEGGSVMEKVKKPCVFVGNHMSTLESFVLPCMIQPHLDVTFVVKKSLVDYPIFGHVMRSCDPIVVQHEGPRKDLRTMLDGGLDRLAKGVSVMVFPQGKRTTSFNPAKFNKIGVKMAKRAGVPIVPVALRTDAWGSNGAWVKDVGKIRPQCPVHFAFGEPIEVNGNERECHEEVLRFIEGKYRQWAEEAPFPEEW